jgi:hypothetical protein
MEEDHLHTILNAETRIIRNAEEFAKAIQSLALVEPETVHVQTPEGHPVALHLLEEMLSDGSIGYTIFVRPAVVS